MENLRSKVLDAMIARLASHSYENANQTLKFARALTRYRASCRRRQNVGKIEVSQTPDHILFWLSGS